MIGDPRLERERTRPTEIVPLEASPDVNPPAGDVEPKKSTYDAETEVLGLCVRYLRGEDVLDGLYETIAGMKG